VPGFLTTAWIEQVEPLLGDMTERVQVVVTGGPDGDVRLGVAEEPDLVLTTPYDDALEMIHGTLDVNVAYMQGRLKTAGDTGVLFRILPATRTPEFAERRQQLQSLTD
jgi:putative sterol carrier protein